MTPCDVFQMLGTDPGNVRGLGIGEAFLARLHSDHLIQVPASSAVIYVSRIQAPKGSSHEWEPQEPVPFDRRSAVLRGRAVT
jgi:hypothetical protein